MPRKSRAEAEQTRQAILDRAGALGSAEGLEGLSLGRLAADLHLSKSGVIGHFDAKEHLQVEAVTTAVSRFTEEVWEPVADRAEGLPRLRAAMDAWLSFLERDVYPGGCFLTAAAHEFDDRPGPIRDVLAAAWRQWHAVLMRDVALAQRAGDLPGSREPAQVTFVLHAVVTQANFTRRLLDDDTAIDRARTEIDAVLSPPPGRPARA